MRALGGLLVVAVVLLVPTTVAVFTVRSGRRRATGTSLNHALAAAMAVALCALGLGGLLGLGPPVATVGAVGLGGSVLAWLPVGRHWAVRGLVAWALTIDAGLLYLAYVIGWMVHADLGPAGTIASTALLLLEAFVFLIGVGYLWELVDVLARRTWTSYVNAGGPAPDGPRPFVSLHVPTHNEPPDLVIETLRSLLALEYDDYEVLVVDNNTDDPALWRPVEAFCAAHPRLRFLHLADWPGYKSGALNEALRVSDPRAEVIGIVDADYVVEPGFLAHCAPLFGDPDVAFVQTPQDYRGWEAAPYFRRLYHSYGYFFDVSQKSRNERNGAIFGGTMGLIRRSALEAVGGWDEWCITEDAELSLRLLRAGGRGLHVDQTFGRGIMPLTFEALKRQRFRWCFGGIQILRMHWRSLLPGRPTEANRLTPSQRWAYLVGGLQWFGDLASLLFTGFLVLGAVDAAVGSGVVVRRLSGLVLVCVAVLVVLGALRSLALVRRTSGATWGESLGAFGLWLALGWTVALASFRGLFAREGVFLRTPKVRGELGWDDAWRGNRVETLVGVACVAIGAWAAADLAAGSVLVGVLLAVQGVAFLAAPVNSLAAIRSDLPEELRRRRREMVPSWGRPAARRGGVVLVATVGALAALVVVAGPVGAPDLVPDLVTEPGGSEHDARDAGSSDASPSGRASGSPTTAIASTRGPSAVTTSPASAATAPAAPSTTRQAQPTPTTQAPTQAPTQVPTTRAPTTPTQKPTGPAATTPTQKPTSKPTQAGGKPSGAGQQATHGGVRP